MLSKLLAAAAAVALAACDSEPATTDAGDPDAAAFQCGYGTAAETCDPSTQYCYEQAAGLFAPAMPGCNPIPSSCPSPPTCECLQAEATDCYASPSCTEDGGLFHLLCVLP